MGSDDPFGRAADTLTAKYARRLADAGVPDPQHLAIELVVMARGHGWRPVEALQPPAVTPSTGSSGQLPEEVRELRAAIDTRPPCLCGAAVLEHELVCGKRAGSPKTGCAAYTPAPGRS
ncbi:hypothetical protein Ssi03_62180 [Sphaerisporangium siamense]|uniref:Uncharacterized protein n=1 Tax=Sphaerisporangium siamense TaxID=795645 RepID=A0A7W7D9N6_9ACTN|nr:hypothetical protein [Sphaerisporangium siamense]MBB4702529.1 hypothetical protein [Sphaerisporangium siamense]GII88228.1 hypothetical protein Ssi03_62180 [Sphaerisporangium siamense]